MLVFDQTCDAERWCVEYDIDGDDPKHLDSGEFVDLIRRVADPCRVWYDLGDGTGTIHHAEGWSFRDGSLVYLLDGEYPEVADQNGVSAGGWQAGAI